MRRAIRAVVVAVVTATALVACAPGGRDVALEEIASGSEESLTMPDFVGPYAEELRQAIRAAQESGAAHVIDILSDGDLTDAEYAGVADGFAQCALDMGAIGAGVHLNLRGGSWIDGGAMSSSTVDQIQSECADSSGLSILSFYGSAGANPDNEDLGVLISTCLVDAGLTGEVLEPGADLTEINELIESLLDDSTESLLMGCTTDPLSLLEHD